MRGAKRKGITLVEGLLCTLLISLIGLSAFTFVGFHNKNVLARDAQISAFTKSIDTVEKLRGNVTTIAQLVDFMNANAEAVKVYAVGFGEVAVVGGMLTVVGAEGYGFMPNLESALPRVFRVEVDGKFPHSKVTTIVRCN